MNTYTTLLIAGSIGWDNIMDFPGEFKQHFHPEKLHQINISFAVKSLEKQMGGTATNIAYAVSQVNKLLENKTKIILLGAVGKDGKEHLDFFKKNSIETSGIIQDKFHYSATGSVITDSRDNQIWGYYYGASEKGKNIKRSYFNNKSQLCVISANHPAAFLTTQKYAIQSQTRYLYDPGMSLTWITGKDLELGVKHCTWLIGNDYEIAMVLKRLSIQMNDLMHMGIRVIVTLGEKGVQYYDHHEIKPVFISAVPKVKVVDPTGAGDAWRGGFIAGLLAGLPTRECLKIGNVTASFTIEHYGTVHYTITKKRFIERNDMLR